MKMGLKLEHLFYVIGIVFLFATISYFSYNYLFDLPDGIKTIILLLLVVVFFVLGEVFYEKDL